LILGGSFRGPQVEIFPSNCANYLSTPGFDVIDGKPVTMSKGFAHWCIPEASMAVQIHASGSFIKDAFQKLRITDVHHATFEP
jgi:hypothetical protein